MALPRQITPFLSTLGRMTDAVTPLQEAKLAIMSVFPLARDGFHIYIGFFVFLFTLLFLKKPLRSFTLLLPALLVAIVIEMGDLRDDLATFGYFRFGASAWDIMNTLVIPFSLVCLGRMSILLRKEEGGVSPEAIAASEPVRMPMQEPTV